MTKQFGKGFANGVILFAISAVSGLVVYLLTASLANWSQPVWWGGEALFPLLFGGATLLIGALPLYALGRIVNVNNSKSGTLWMGAIVGLLLLPLQKVLAFLLASTPSLNLLGPIITIFLLFALAGVAAILFSATIVTLCRKTMSSKA